MATVTVESQLFPTGVTVKAFPDPGPAWPLKTTEQVHGTETTSGTVSSEGRLELGGLTPGKRYALSYEKAAEEFRFLWVRPNVGESEVKAISSTNSSAVVLATTVGVSRIVEFGFAATVKAKFSLRDGGSGGKIVKTITLALGESTREPTNIPIQTGGIYLTMTEGTIEGDITWA